LKLPRLLTGWWCSLPLKLPGESSRKRSGDDAQGVLGELGILLGGFRESKAIQLWVDLNRLHATIIPSPSGSAFMLSNQRPLSAVNEGKHIAMFPPETPAEDKGPAQVTFLLNFFDELRRRVPVGK